MPFFECLNHPRATPFEALNICGGFALLRLIFPNFKLNLLAFH